MDTAPQMAFNGLHITVWIVGQYSWDTWCSTEGEAVLASRRGTLETMAKKVRGSMRRRMSLKEQPYHKINSLGIPSVHARYQTQEN